MAAVVVAATTASCVPKHQASKPVATTDRPFDRGPIATLVDPLQTGPLYRVQIAADITRDVIPTDDLAIVISVRDEVVGRYPVVGTFVKKPTRIKQEIELPLGDYDIQLEHQGTRYAGMPFRLAEVPVWGGKRVLQLRAHPGTRISLREKKLWVGRWWANDGRPQAWIIEWVREGQVVTKTSGAEKRGIPPQTSRVVVGAAAAHDSERLVNHTIWMYGEEYPVPDVVAQQPGVWAARVVHGASPPVAVVFHVLEGGRLGELSSRRVASVGWEESWSKPLVVRALAATEVERLRAMLPRIGSDEPIDELPPRQQTLEPPIRLSQRAVRALFRSKQLAELWSTFVALNAPASGYVALHPGTQPVVAGKRHGAPPPATSPANDHERRARLKALRTQIEQLIKQHGGPWQPDEFPRS